jgi:MFS transporter, FHS family, glucose/mannose:H+ symporter
MGSVIAVDVPRKPLWTPTAVAHAAFIPTGIVTVLLGPVLPSLSARWSLSDAQAGEFFTAEFLASTLGVVLSGALVPRLGYKSVIVLGLIFMAAGVGVLPMGSRLLGMAAVAGYGLGLGLTIPACNLLVAELNPGKRAAAVSLLNFSWTVGAVACPFLFTPFQRRAMISPFFYVLGGFVLLIALLIARVSFPPPSRSEDASSQPTKPLLAMLQTPVALVLAVLFFVYVGTENAMGGWLASYAKRLSGSGGTVWVTVPSFFYAGLLANRALAPFFLRRVSEIWLARMSMGIALLGLVILLSARSMPVIIVSAAVIGLGLATIYPITIALLSSSFGAAANRVGSVMFMMASFGAACMPWMVGVTSTHMQSLKIGLTIPLGACALMLGLFFRDWSAKDQALGSGL